MGLYQRWTATDASKIPVHRWGASVRQWVAGQLTRQQIIDMHVLTGSDIVDLDAMQATYTALPTNNTPNIIIKAQWPDRMEDVVLLCETGDYTEAKAKQALGF
jgi:hypothetical protein